MSDARKWLVFAGILVGMAAATIEKSIVATALPTITRELGGLSLYSWVFGAYMLASTITIPLFSKLADLKGRRPLYLGGMVIFLGGTLLAATASSMSQLILYRLIQGTGAGAIAPAALAAIGDIFPHKTRGRAFGIIGAVSILANLAGPLLGGWVTDQLSWRWGFILILPIGLLAALLVAVGYPAQTAIRKAIGPIDWQGAGLLGVSLSLGLVGLQMMGDGGRTLWPGVGLALSSGFIFWLGLNWEKRHPDPALPLYLLRDPLMKTILIGTLFLGAVTHSAIAYLPLFIQGVRGGTATDAGVTLLPMLISAGVASGVGGWLSSRAPRQTTITAWALAVLACVTWSI
jgi:MFS family permease